MVVVAAGSVVVDPRVVVDDRVDAELPRGVDDGADVAAALLCSFQRLGNCSLSISA